MSDNSASSLRKLQHPAFAGLSDKALVAFYSLGTIESIEPGDWLFRPGDAASHCYLVLTGQARLVTSVDAAEQGHTVSQGSCLSPLLYQRGQESAYGLRAVSKLGVLHFEEARLAGLDAELQLQIMRNLAGLNARAAADLLQVHATQSAGMQLLAQRVIEDIEEQCARYSASRPIMELLHKLPRLPSYATRLSQIISDPNFSTREAFETAKLDPSLTASVLKTVNSSAYALKHKVMDFQHAFLLLGFNQIQQIIMNQGIQSVMPKTPEFQQLQLHCVMVSALCQEISLTVKHGNAPSLGTIGLLHDIGKSVLLLLKRDQPQLGFLISQLDADVIGTMLLREWGIPEDISSCMQYQSLPCRMPPGVIPESRRVTMAILYLAHLCCDFLMEKPLEPRQLRFSQDYLRVLGSAATSVEAFIRDELLLSVQPRMNNLPKVIQNFLRKGVALTSARKDEVVLSLDGKQAGVAARGAA